MPDAPADVVATYFRAWKAGDLDTFRSVLADDVTFVGPLGRADDADSCRDGMAGLSAITTDIVVHRTFVDGPDVLTWFDLHTSVATISPVANLSRVEDGRITRIRVTFDPRPFTDRSGS